MENQSGITLIALVVSIVVMLILVGVTITIVIEDGGIFSQTKRATDLTANRIDYESNVLGSEMQEFVNGALNNLIGQ